jgi:hypothetical protein
MLRQAPLILSIVVALSGCASATAGGTSSAGQTTRRDTNVITAEELASSPESDLYGAVKRLRPSFFETRGTTSLGVGTVPEKIQVYVDGTRATISDGSSDPASVAIATLSQLRPNEVKEVRRLSASEATQRYGTNHTMGAIVVTRK